MKVQEVVLRAMARRITWWQAAEILGMTDRSLAALIKSDRPSVANPGIPANRSEQQ